MIIKAVLVIWIGMGNTQSLSTVKFDSVAECESFREELIQFDNDFNSKYVKCIPYEVK